MGGKMCTSGDLVGFGVTMSNSRGSFTTTTPPPTPFFNPLLEQQTPTFTTKTSTNPTLTLPEIPSFASVFKFYQRVSALESEMSEFNQTNQFAEAVSSIPGIVDTYPASKMKEAVDVAVQLQTNKLREEAQAENQEFINQTSYAVAASLSEFELKKILIDKMETNKSIYRSDNQKNLYNALVESYNSDKDIITSYGDVVILKRGRDDKDKDEDPSTGSDRGTKRRKSGKDAESSKDSRSKEKKSLSTSKDTSQSQHKSSGKSAHAEEPSHTVEDSIIQAARAEEPPTLFDKFNDTSFDFSAFVLNRLKISNLTQEILGGPAFNLLKVIMDYLVKINKKAHILELKQRHLKILTLKSYMPYPSRKIRRIQKESIRRIQKESIRRIQYKIPPFPRIPCDLHPRLPLEDFVMFELLDDAIGIYHWMFDLFGNRIPFSSFLLALIKHYMVHFSQLGPLGLNKRRAPSPVCIDDNRSCMKHWKGGFFFIDRRAIPDAIVWRHPNAAINDSRPAVVMGILDFLCLPEWNGAEVQEEPHFDVRPTLQRLPFYCTPLIEAETVILDPTPKDLGVGTPSFHRCRCARTELITPNLMCPSTYQLLQNSGGDSGPDLSFDKSAFLERFSDSDYEEDSEDTCEDLSTPYKRPKPTPFTTRITRFKYHQRAKLPSYIKVYEGNKDPENHLGIFSAVVEQEKWPMPIWCKIHPELAKKLNYKIPKIVDEMSEIVRAFFRGEVATRLAENHRKEQSKGIQKECEDMCSLLKKRNIHTPHQNTEGDPDRGHNTNDRYHLKKQTEETMASGKLAHLFAIVKCRSPYNVILGRTGMRSLGAARSTIHSMIKFTMANGVATLKTSWEALRICRHIEEMQNSWEETPGKEPMTPEGSWEEDTVKEKVVIHDDRLDQPIVINGKLSIECKQKLVKILRKKVDVFGWTLVVSMAVPRFIMEHQLKAYPLAEPVIHKKRPLNSDQRMVLKPKVLEWLKARIIRRV
ncbi:hypothetical protein Tco_0206742 [Tanacetum coccineum]